MKAKQFFIMLCILSLSAYSLAQEQESIEKPENPQKKGTVTLPDKTPEGEEQIYVIKKGDTLWHISGRFLNNPFRWPVVWKANPYIVNPHLIYPGNVVKISPWGEIIVEEKGDIAAIPEGLTVEKLQKPEEAPLPAEEAQKEEVVTMLPPALEEPAPEVIKISSALMERHGLISVKEMKGSGVIIGSKEERLLLARGDMVFISLAKGTEAKKGDRFTIFATTDEVKHPVTDKPVGFLIETLGMLEVINTEADGAIAAKIDVSYKEILKGARLKAYEPPVKEVAIKKGGNLVEGFIIASLEGKTGVAEADIVYLDKGRSSGLEQGITMSIFRPREPIADPLSGEEKKVISPPPAELGRLVIVNVEEDTSTAFITKSRQVIYKGDRVKTAE